MQNLFLKSECIFRSKSAQFSVKIVCADIVANMFENCAITKTVCYSTNSKVDSEISMNLLEQMLTFSFAKDICEKHKATKKNVKAFIADRNLTSKLQY